MARPQRHALALTAGKHARTAVEHMLDAENFRRFLHPSLNFFRLEFHALEREGHVFIDVQMRIKRETLEHHGDIALERFQLVDHLPVKKHLAGGRLFQARHQAQKRALAAAGRPQKHHEFMVAHGKVNIRKRLCTVGVGHTRALERNFCHNHLSYAKWSDRKKGRSI